MLWLFVIGSGFSSALQPSLTTSGIDYQKFIYPGIISMSIIFSSAFFGSYIIRDRKFDFLKSVMVSPVSRDTVFVGKTLGGMTTSLGTSSNTFSYRRSYGNSLFFGPEFYLNLSYNKEAICIYFSFSLSID